MGWMKRIYAMVQEGTFEKEFSSKYRKAKANKKETILKEQKESILGRWLGVGQDNRNGMSENAFKKNIYNDDDDKCKMAMTKSLQKH